MQQKKNGKTWKEKRNGYRTKTEKRNKDRMLLFKARTDWKLMREIKESEKRQMFEMWRQGERQKH